MMKVRQIENWELPERLLPLAHTTGRVTRATPAVKSRAAITDL